MYIVKVRSTSTTICIKKIVTASAAQLLLQDSTQLIYNARHYQTSHSALPRNVTSIRLLLSQRFHTGNRTSTISPGIISFYLVVATVPVPLDKLKMKLSKAFSRLAFAARADNLMRCNLKTCRTHIDNTFQLMYITVSSSYAHFKAQQQPHIYIYICIF